MFRIRYPEPLHFNEKPFLLLQRELRALNNLDERVFDITCHEVAAIADREIFIQFIQQRKRERSAKHQFHGNSRALYFLISILSTNSSAINVRPSPIAAGARIGQVG
jgi:hypothetical protein